VFLAPGDVKPRAPTSFEFFDGLVSFEAVACTPGETITVTIDYGRELPEKVEVFKSGSPYVRLSSTQSETKVTYSVTDGGVGDADGKINGVIVDPAGAVLSSSLSPTPVPTNSKLMLLLLALLLSIYGVYAIHYSPLNRRDPL